MKRPVTGTGLFYSRDSGGQHETGLRGFVDWARKEALKLGVAFAPPQDVIDVILGKKLTSYSGVFLDYGVSGNILNRPALTELQRRLATDSQVTHVFIPRRDRLARPDDAVDGMQLETELRQKGVTLVFMDVVAPPIRLGQRRDLADGLMAYLDYD
jgi:hypothetical protein